VASCLPQRRKEGGATSWFTSSWCREPIWQIGKGGVVGHKRQAEWLVQGKRVRREGGGQDKVVRWGK
jgi:hypothetical protein